MSLFKKMVLIPETEYLQLKRINNISTVNNGGSQSSSLHQNSSQRNDSNVSPQKIDIRSQNSEKLNARLNETYRQVDQGNESAQKNESQGHSTIQNENSSIQSPDGTTNEESTIQEGRAELSRIEPSAPEPS